MKNFFIGTFVVLFLYGCMTIIVPVPAGDSTVHVTQGSIATVAAEANRGDDQNGEPE